MTPICSYSELSLGKGLSVLAALRSVAIAGQLAFLAFASWGLMLPLPTVPMLVVISTLAVWNIAVYWRLKQPWEVTAAEAFLNLAVDIAGLSLLFYWSGGATNPFVSLFLIPIAFAAVILPYRYVAGVSLLCVVCYSLLMVFYIPLPAIDPQFGGDFNVHVLGMWVNFLISAVLMAVVVGGVAGSLRERERQLSKSREEALINERIVAMGALSAGISHEINTPLSTMTLVVDELMDRPGQDPEVYQDLDLLITQIAVCKDRLRELLDATGSSRSENAQGMRLSRFIGQIVERWRTVRPEIRVQVSLEEPFHDPAILAEQTIGQSITNLLNNAADASVANLGDTVRVNVVSDGQWLLIRIDDQGKGGVPSDLGAQAGRVAFSTKESGLGIGLILSNASLGRFGGEVLLLDNPGGGTRTQIRLPITGLVIESGGGDGKSS